MTTFPPIVRQIVDRCSVGQSYRSVISYVASRMKGGRKTFLVLPRETRREIMEAAVEVHRENQRMYNWVMRGGGL